MPAALWPTWQHLIAFANKALDDPAAITTVGAGVALNQWTDVSPYIARFAYEMGRHHELGVFEPGLFNAELKNDDGRWNPWNTASPYAGYLRPMRLYQLRAVYNAVSYTCFTGHVKTFPVRWPDPMSQRGGIEGTDALAILAGLDITSTGYATLVNTKSPRVYYRMGDPPGSLVLHDSSGNGRDGTLVGAPVLSVPGALVADTDTAVDFGTRLAGVNLPFGSALAGAGAMWLDTWVRLDGPPDAGGIDYFYSQVWGSALLTMFMNSDRTVQAAWSDGVHSAFVNSTRAIPLDGTFHHFAWTRAADGKTCTMYVDGTPAGVLVDSAVVNFVAMVAYLAIDQYGSYRFNGALDEFSMGLGALTAADVLARYNAGVGQWANQTSGQRIASVLDVVGVSAGARVIDAGTSRLAPVTASLATTSAKSYCEQVENTEDGAFFVDGAGRFKFLSRSNKLMAPYNVSAATLGDNPSEIPYQVAPDLAEDDLDIWNEIPVSRATGAVQVARDQPSIDDYGRRTRQGLLGLLMSTDAEARDRASWELAHYKDPVTRLRSIVMRPLDDPANMWPVVLGAYLLQRVTVNRHSVPGGGDAFVEVAQLEHMKLEVSADEAVATWSLAPGDAQAYWVWGTSKWGTDTRWAY